VINHDGSEWQSEGDTHLSNHAGEKAFTVNTDTSMRILAAEKDFSGWDEKCQTNTDTETRTHGCVCVHNGVRLLCLHGVHACWARYSSAGTFGTSGNGRS
jgi:hypothetical protein